MIFSSFVVEGLGAPGPVGSLRPTAGQRNLLVFRRLYPSALRWQGGGWQNLDPEAGQDADRGCSGALARGIRAGPP
jgi:hypothetical protein